MNTRPDAARLREIADQHWLAMYQPLVALVGGEWRRFGGVNGFRTPHIPASFANGCLIVEPATATDLGAAVRWVSEASVPFAVRVETVSAAEILDAAAQLGLVRSGWDFPGMILEPIPDMPAPAHGVSSARVDRDNYDDFMATLTEQGFPAEIARSAFGESIVDIEGVALFVAYLDGRAAGTSVLVRTGDVSGIYTVGVAEWARRRGVGSAVTWLAVERAREWGSWAVILQSTRMGFGVYRSMGFRTVVEYAFFAPPGVPIDG